VARLIDSASNLMHRTMMMLLYATGLRRAEMCHLKVADIDSTRMVIHVRQGKGDLSEDILSALKLDWSLLKTDRIKYTEKTVEVYSKEELANLFGASSQEETDLFQFLLCTGVREQEAVHATWADVDIDRKKFHVREKRDHLAFTPKDNEERSILIPDSLVDLLQARRKRAPNSRLIFPGADGKPDSHFPRVLQELAFRAGLNCGECYNKKGKCCYASGRGLWECLYSEAFRSSSSLRRRACSSL
jgi:integrase